MTKILITKEKAIKLLNDRIADLYKMGFDHVAWKSRTVYDIAEIFGDYSKQYLDASHVYFSVAYPGTHDQTKNTLKQLLQSFIDFINDHIADPPNPDAQRSVWGIEYQRMIRETAETEKDNKALIKKVSELDFSIGKKNEELAAKNSEIQRLKDNVFQTENITLIKLWRFFIHLPWEGILGIWIVLAATFSLGVGLAHLLKL